MPSTAQRFPSQGISPEAGDHAAVMGAHHENGFLSGKRKPPRPLTLALLDAPYRTTKHFRRTHANTSTRLGRSILRLRRPWNSSKRLHGERSSTPDSRVKHEPRGEVLHVSERVATRHAGDNLWSFLRHGPTSWAALARVFVCCLGLLILAGLLIGLLWLLGFRIGFGGIVDIGPSMPTAVGHSR